MTVAQFAPGWLERKQQQKRAPKTLQRYREIVHLHIIPALGRKRLALLKVDEVEELYAAKIKAGLSSNTVHHIHTVLHGILESAVRHGYATSNVSEHAENKPGLEIRKGNVWKQEDARRFLRAAAGDRLAALYMLALTTGMREGELLGLRWQDVDLDRGELTIQQSLSYGHEEAGDHMHFIVGKPKTPLSERNPPLTPHVVEALREHQKRQLEERSRLDDLWDTRYDLVFCNGIGRPIEATNFLKREFYRLLEREGLPRITFHGLRRTIATLLKGENAHPKDVAALLGHASTKLTLDTYAQMLPGVQAALVQKIEKLFWGESETNGGQNVGHVS